MVKTDLLSLIERALGQMERDGASVNLLRQYRRTGFGAIQQYCQQIGETDYSSEVIGRFVLQTRSKYEQDEISRWEWGIVRRGAELLKQFHNNGTLDLKPCQQWKSLHHALHREPTSQEAENPNNIIVLVRRTERALANLGLTPKTLENYRYDGFDRLLRAHNELGQTNYNPQLTVEFAQKARDDYEKGEMCRSVCQNIRKASSLLAEFHSTGTISWRQLQQYGLRQLNDVFAGLLRQFCADVLRIDTSKLSRAPQITYPIRQMLITLEDSGFYTFEYVTPRILNECIMHIAQRYSSGISTMLSGLRKFLTYLYSNGSTKVDLSKSLPEMVASRKRIRDGWSEEEIAKLLAAADTTTVIGKRDYAIMLLASRTGLRGCDVISLKRQEINWHTKEINIVQVKTGVAITIPLPIESGNAIADYLLNARPVGGEPYVFLRTDQPYSRLKSICGIMPRYMQRAGIVNGVCERRGFHSFRRAYGKQLLAAETPIDMFGELFGHTNMDSAKPYMAIDETGLKLCALGLVKPVLGGAEI